MSSERITEMLYLMMLLFALGNAEAAGLIHLPIMLLPSVAIAFVCSRCVFKIKNLGVILILNCLTYSALAYTRFEFCFLCNGLGSGRISTTWRQLCRTSVMIAWRMCWEGLANESEGKANSSSVCARGVKKLKQTS